MKINRIHAGNFKGILGDTSVNLGDLTVISGKNSSGKSSLIQVLRYLTQWATRIKTDSNDNPYSVPFLDIYDENFVNENPTYNSLLNSYAGVMKEEEYRYKLGEEEGFIDDLEKGRHLDMPEIYGYNTRYGPPPTEEEIVRMRKEFDLKKVKATIAGSKGIRLGVDYSMEINNNLTFIAEFSIHNTDGQLVPLKKLSTNEHPGSDKIITRDFIHPDTGEEDEDSLDGPQPFFYSPEERESLRRFIRGNLTMQYLTFFSGGASGYGVRDKLYQQDPYGGMLTSIQNIKLSRYKNEILQEIWPIIDNLAYTEGTQLPINIIGVEASLSTNEREVGLLLNNDNLLGEQHSSFLTNWEKSESYLYRNLFTHHFTKTVYGSGRSFMNDLVVADGDPDGERSSGHTKLMVELWNIIAEIYKSGGREDLNRFVNEDDTNNPLAGETVQHRAVVPRPYPNDKSKWLESIKNKNSIAHEKLVEILFHSTGYWFDGLSDSDMDELFENGQPFQDPVEFQEPADFEDPEVIADLEKEERSIREYQSQMFEIVRIFCLFREYIQELFLNNTVSNFTRTLEEIINDHDFKWSQEIDNLKFAAPLEQLLKIRDSFGSAVKEFGERDLRKNSNASKDTATCVCPIPVPEYTEEYGDAWMQSSSEETLYLECPIDRYTQHVYILKPGEEEPSTGQLYHTYDFVDGQYEGHIKPQHEIRDALSFLDEAVMSNTSRNEDRENPYETVTVEEIVSTALKTNDKFKKMDKNRKKRVEKELEDFYKGVVCLKSGSHYQSPQSKFLDSLDENLLKELTTKFKYLGTGRKVTENNLDPVGEYKNNLPVGKWGGRLERIMKTSGRKKVDSFLVPSHNDEGFFRDYENLDWETEGPFKFSLEGAIDFWVRYIDMEISSPKIEMEGSRPVLKVSGKDGSRRDLSQVGSGVAQALPVIAACLLAKPGEIVCIEEPESHLHPAAQAQMADFLLSMAASGRQIVVETHSPNIIDRLRFRRAHQKSWSKFESVDWMIGNLDEERTLSELKEDYKEFIEPDIQIIFAEQGEAGTKYREGAINDKGDVVFTEMSDDPWPKGFFDNVQEDISNILKARKSHFQENLNDSGQNQEEGDSPDRSRKLFKAKGSSRFLRSSGKESEEE